MGRPKVLHLSTLHQVNDVRIYERECRSLKDVGKFDILIAAPGNFVTDSGIKHVRLPFARNNRFLRILLSQFFAVYAVIRVRPILLHLHDPELLLVGILAREILRIEVVWDAHEDYWGQLEKSDSAKAWIPNAIRPAVSKLLMLTLNKADNSLSAVIGATSGICLRYRNQNTILVGNEARLEDFMYSKPNFESANILFTGSFSDAACFPEVVDALIIQPKLHLLLAGRSAPRNWSEIQKKLGSRAQYVGWLSREDLSKVISICCLGLVTYADSYATFDNAPTKYFEFAASGLPVVATPTQSNLARITRARNGVLASGYSAVAISDAISLALSSRTEWNAWSENGRTWVQSHGNWKQSEGRLIDLYTKLLVNG